MKNEIFIDTCDKQYHCPTTADKAARTVVRKNIALFFYILIVILSLLFANSEFEVQAIATLILLWHILAKYRSRPSKHDNFVS